MSTILPTKKPLDQSRGARGAKRIRLVLRLQIVDAPPRHNAVLERNVLTAPPPHINPAKRRDRRRFAVGLSSEHKQQFLLVHPASKAAILNQFPVFLAMWVRFKVRRNQLHALRFLLLLLLLAHQAEKKQENQSDNRRRLQPQHNRPLEHVHPPLFFVAYAEQRCLMLDARNLCGTFCTWLGRSLSRQPALRGP